ncbi:low-density lipoprotein receptor-related protein 6-like [Pecten maximus]|uniref:low-density lipoprotein receptor-related protein 6-like n=1 Tax=Pecten maximus TaxID=6579 RepID=UPI001458460A|nr:low-density lipoprotein receptor-related protein 6-like [Pecten maximus]
MEWGWCGGVHPRLLLANRINIKTLQADTGKVESVIRNLTDVAAVDFDYNDGFLFWGDISNDQIIRAKKTANGSVVDIAEIAGEDVRTPEGIAVDWLYNHVYWTDVSPPKIEVMSYDGKLRRSLVTESLDKPRAIVVDPSQGWMYWTDWGNNPMISRCGLNGKHRRLLVNEDIVWPNGLTIGLLSEIMAN